MQKKITAVMVFSFALTASAVHAQNQGTSQMPAVQEQGNKNQRGACRSDAQNLCKGMQGKAVRSCLLNNLDKIQNPACKAMITKAAAAIKAADGAVKQACAGDITQDKCTGMDIGTGLLKCLGQNRKSLSDGCKTELMKIRQARMARGRMMRRGRGNQAQGNQGGQGAQGVQGSQGGQQQGAQGNQGDDQQQSDDDSSDSGQ